MKQDTNGILSTVGNPILLGFAELIPTETLLLYCFNIVIIIMSTTAIIIIIIIIIVIINVL